MSTFDVISDAAAYSRAHGQVAKAYADSEDDALEALIDCLQDDEDYDYVVDGDVMDFWAWESSAHHDEMTVRAQVILGDQS